ncbi:MAG TPA: UDP-N-acetylmuramoyl-L-alanine--D-glutamate ligase, partial [Chitinophagales bacterium]|nr:UDP-N-acetylmuramoyl-L-alanine--D-glutamate ligase [Chitinophagales bacterium]
MNKLIVLGAGESGLGAALLGQQQGYSVFVSDAGKILPETKIIFEEAGIKYEEENHNVNEILAGNLVVKSPGIAENTPVVQAIRNKKELPLV